MKVAVATQFFPPETFAGANRVAAMAAALAEAADVTVAAPDPTYPDRAAYVGAPAPELVPGARLVRVAPMRGRRGSWAARAVAEGAMATRVAGAAAGTRPDVVVASSPSMFLGPAALAAARSRRARVVWDLRDLTWEYGKDDDVVANRAARAGIAVVARVMWWTARRVDLLTCANEGLGNAIRARLTGCRVEVVPNGIDDGLLHALDPAPAPAADRLRVLYAGLVGHAQGLEVLLDAARHSPDIAFTIAGDGPRREPLEAEAKARGLANVAFTGYLRRDELVRRYHESDVLFAQLQRSELHAATAAPSKLLEYMAAGRPIVYAGEGSAAALVERAGAGIVVPPGDAPAVAEAVASLSPDERLRLGAAARAYAESLPTRVEAMRRLAALVIGAA
jgi:glycosyltransferase involved in cell wall biosynthesis